jgi:hypothetical protein
MIHITLRISAYDSSNIDVITLFEGVLVHDIQVDYKKVKDFFLQNNDDGSNKLHHCNIIDSRMLMCCNGRILIVFFNLITFLFFVLLNLYLWLLVVYAIARKPK